MKSNLINGIDADYAHCRRLAASHYENFPVASRLLPASMRDPVAAVYAFARTADDLADEGQVSTQQRLDAIDALQQQLQHCLAGGRADDPVCRAAADACRRHDLPPGLLLDLLSAFRQDVTCKRYADDAALLDYCRRSANPVGRLLLHLCDRARQPCLAQSDALCTALQLINFLQDLAPDYHQRGRLYLPLDALHAHGLRPRDLFVAEPAAAVQALLDDRLAMIGQLLERAAPLAAALPGRLALETRLTWLAADRVRRGLQRRGAAVQHRCRLGAMDRALLLLGLLAGRGR